MTRTEYTAVIHALGEATLGFLLSSHRDACEQHDGARYEPTVTDAEIIDWLLENMEHLSWADDLLELYRTFPAQQLESAVSQYGRAGGDNAGPGPDVDPNDNTTGAKERSV